MRCGRGASERGRTLEILTQPFYFIMNKSFALCLAALALTAAPLTTARAQEAAAPATAPASGVTALPASVRINEIVIIRRHRHYRTERVVYYRHGVRHVRIRRIYD